MKKKSAYACELNTLYRLCLDNVFPKAYEGTSGRSFARSFMASNNKKQDVELVRHPVFERYFPNI